MTKYDTRDDLSLIPCVRTVGSRRKYSPLDFLGRGPCLSAGGPTRRPARKTDGDFVATRSTDRHALIVLIIGSTERQGNSHKSLTLLQYRNEVIICTAGIQLVLGNGNNEVIDDIT